jgi:LytS/YehU family sensor histidine kinase
MPRRVGLVRAFIAGAGGQAGAVALSQVAVVGLHHFAFTRPALASMAANGFGVLILRVVLREAGLRADSERHRQESERDRLEVERARTLVAEAQLVALRARVHPHFLFNTLTSIAALCGFAPAQAETAIVRLSQVMRRALDANPAAPVCLADEIEFARGYVEIEQYRLGSRLEVVWDIDAAGAGMQVPAFSLQTLVENAILHGIAPQIGPGTVRIVIRCYRRHTFVAVQDNGIGMTTQECLAALAPAIGQEHGLQIVAAQLRLLYGARGRLRLFSRQTKGTIAAFAVPNAPEPEGIVKIAHEDIDRADRG